MLHVHAPVIQSHIPFDVQVESVHPGTHSHALPRVSKSQAYLRIGLQTKLLIRLPLYPFSQLHTPYARSQEPCPEHSNGFFFPVEYGHTNSEHVSPV
jgi:hypothetical protein